jgi:hypothetical protein
MERHVTPLEAHGALNTIERSRLRIIDEIDMPRWYWWSLALGWIALGFVNDLGQQWITLGATLAFGVAHATVASRVLSGRHRTPDLSVRADVAGRQVPRLVIGALLLLVGLTVAGSLAASADGARHPATVASIVVAVIVLLGGPRLLAVVRRKAARAVMAS